MEMKHTQGEWEVGPKIGKGTIAINSDKGILIATVWFANPTHPVKKGAAKANAKLIAAAPELLEALEYIRREIRKEGVEDYFDTNIIAKAIKKATL